MICHYFGRKIHFIMFLLVSIFLISCSNKIVEQAKSFMDIGDYKNAITILEEHLKKKPDDVQSRKILIDCYDLAGNWKKEIDQVKILNNLEESKANDYLLLRLYAQLEHWDKYITLNKNIKIPDIDSLMTIDLLTAKGLYKLYQNDDEYIEYFEKVIQKDSTYRKIISSPILNVLQKMDEPEIDDYYFKADRYYADIQDYYELRGELFNIIGDYENAITEFAKQIIWFDNDEDSFMPAFIIYENMIHAIIKTKQYDLLRKTINEFLYAYAQDDSSNYVFASLWYLQTQIPDKPTVITSIVDSADISTAICGGSIITNGGATKISKGICWDHNSEPTINNNFIEDTSSGNSIKCKIENLDYHTKYYVRAYASNENGIVYGNQITFRTLSPTYPKLSPSIIKDIKHTSIKATSDLIDEGSSEVKELGFCWSTESGPTTNDNKKTIDNNYFAINISGLNPGEKYYIRSYGINNEGIGYGEQEIFATPFEFKLDSLVDIDGNAYQTVKIGDQWWMAENLRTLHYNNGDQIPICKEKNKWVELDYGAACYYGNNKSNEVLYNWYVISDPRGVAPEGWHVATDDDWRKLEEFLGKIFQVYNNLFTHQDNAGYALKSVSGWSGNGNGIDYCNFNAKPTGYRNDYFGNFRGKNNRTFYWTKTKVIDDIIWTRTLSAYNYKIDSKTKTFNEGCSIRCVRDN